MHDRPLDLVINQLKTYDETEVCDLLHITSEDLCHKFKDRIAARRKYLETELEMYPNGDKPDEDKDYDNGFQELDFE